jgi:hypothetical protein
MTMANDARKANITHCGVYCGACSWQRGGEDNRHLTEKGRNLEPKELEYWTSCPGCTVGKHRAEDCDFRICATGKNLGHCIECTDFPCERHKEFNGDGVPHHAGSIASLTFLKENGADAWLEMQEKIWTCACGANLSWYLQRCLKCGKEARPLKKDRTVVYQIYL